MKQLKHNNILPLRGVSATVSEFCLVFPWCDNGQIMDYLKKMPDANRFDLASTSGPTIYSGRLPLLTNSYWVRPVDCVTCTITV